MKKAKVKTRFGATIYAKPLIYEIMISERLYLMGSEEWLFTKLLGRFFGPWISRRVSFAFPQTLAHC